MFPKNKYCLCSDKKQEQYFYDILSFRNFSEMQKTIMPPVVTTRLIKLGGQNRQKTV